MKKLLCLATAILMMQLQAMEQDSKIKSLRDLCIKTVAHYLPHEADKLVTRILKTKRKDNFNVVLDALPAECIAKIKQYYDNDLESREIVELPKWNRCLDVWKTKLVRSFVKDIIVYSRDNKIKERYQFNDYCNKALLSNDEQCVIAQLATSLWVIDLKNNVRKNLGAKKVITFEFDRKTTVFYTTAGSDLWYVDIISGHNILLKEKICCLDMVCFFASNRLMLWAGDKACCFDIQKKKEQFNFHLGYVNGSHSDDKIAQKIIALHSGSKKSELLAIQHSPSYKWVEIHKLTQELESIANVNCTDFPEIKLAAFAPSGKYIAFGSTENDFSLFVFTIDSKQCIFHKKRTYSMYDFPICKMWWSNGIMVKDELSRVYRFLFSHYSANQKIQEYLDKKQQEKA